MNKTYRNHGLCFEWLFAVDEERVANPTVFGDWFDDVVDHVSHRHLTVCTDEWMVSELLELLESDSPHLWAVATLGCPLEIVLWSGSLL